MRRRSHGVATILSTLILIAITVVGAVVVYQAVVRSAISHTNTGQLAVQSVKLLMVAASGQGSGLFSIDLENSGTKAVTGLTLTVDNVVQVPQACPPPQPPQPPQLPTFCLGSSTVDTSNMLNPNYMISAVGLPGTVGGPFVLNFGQAYPYNVVATYADGSTSVVAGSVIASNS